MLDLISVVTETEALMDLRGAPGMHAPLGSKFFHFHAVFGKKLKNNRIFGSWHIPLRKILDLPLRGLIYIRSYSEKNKFVNDF